MIIWRYPSIILILISIYWAVVFNSDQFQSDLVRGSGDRVVVAAPLQVALAFGDRYLAANFETIRLAATGMNVSGKSGQVDGQYLLRGHLVVSELNPCHEDNYYLANALLAWGGAQGAANSILWDATQCRHWDFLPAFLYGFNEYFFNRDIGEAQKALEIAANRSAENSVAMKQFSIMIGLEEFDDEAMALAYLQQQQKQTEDPALSESLRDRVDRLLGLIQLREAQFVYESEYGEPLTSPQTLLEKGLLDSFPVDPLGIGYEFIDGQFKLRELSIQGVERPQ